MKSVNIVISLLVLALLMACGKATESQHGEVPGPDSSEVQPSSAPPQPSPESVVFLNNPGSETQGQAHQADVAASINPPHGQPGHRCDIAVGAPLSSPPGKPPAAPAVVLPAVAPVGGQQGNTPTSATPAVPGMNPPHGQPNHRCDIAVGAPLNSPPGKPPEAASPPGTAPVPKE
jgi:hypothetical protein